MINLLALVYPAARRNLGKIVPEKRMREAAFEAVNGEPVPGIRVL
jgi:hypothetical protein